MNILALETSGDFCSVALWRDGAIQDREMPAGQRQSGLILDMVHELLAASGVSIAQIDGVAFGAGPGAFTGLRIACGVAQGLALGIDKPVAGVNSLLALASASGAARAVCCIDARMGEVYHAAFEKVGEAWHPVQDAGVCAPNEVPRLPGVGWMGCGNGFSVYRDALTRCYGAQLDAVNATLYARARDVAALAAPVFAQGAGTPAERAAPIYVRDKVALKTHER